MASPYRIRRALVTGASAGLGAEFARQLAARGTDLVLVARREDRLRQLADDLAEAHGVEVEVLAADLVQADDVEQVAKRLTAVSGPVDLLVNNAGFGMYGEFARLDGDRQLQMLQLNAAVLTRLTHAIVPQLRAAGAGGVVNVASTAAFQPDPYGAVYGATKAYVLSLSQALHEELARDGVRVLALCPGFTRTEFQDIAGVNQAAMPSAGVMEAGPVVRAALADFTRGRAVCLPGTVNKITGHGASMMPTVVSRRLSKAVHRRFQR